MSPFADLPCWVIMGCGEDKKCPAKEHPSQNCWEIYLEMDDQAFNVCQDCIVFLSRQAVTTLSRAEMEQIMNNKGIVLSLPSTVPSSQVDN